MVEPFCISASAAPAQITAKISVRTWSLMELVLIVRNLPRQERFEGPLSLGCKCTSRVRGILRPSGEESVRTSEGLTLRGAKWNHLKPIPVDFPKLREHVG